MPMTAADPPANDHLSCCGCGYLLRGLDAGGRCPECGESIARSIAAERARLLTHVGPLLEDSALVRANPRWLFVILIGCIGLLVVHACAFAAVGGEAILTRWSNSNLLVVTGICLAASAWLLSVPG